MKKIAIIGSGIAGTSAAYYLDNLGYSVYLFEAGSYFGGHTNTIDIELAQLQVPIDTGFLVHNDRTYPNLIHFFNELEIQTSSSEMTFSVMRLVDNLIWTGTNVFTVFIQMKNIFSPRFYKFLSEVLHFNRNSKKYLLECENNMGISLGELLIEKKYSEDFKNWYLLPMGGCIWSTPTNEMLKFPAFTFLRFCMNHGLLQIFDRPKWKTVKNGCKTYVKKALDNISNKFLQEPVLAIQHGANKIILTTSKRTEEFDYCIMCNHPPEILSILKECDDKTKRLLTSFKYQKNIAVLHLDQKVLPENKKAWAAWNYLSVKAHDSYDAVSVSYLINKLQNLPSEEAVIVTLNPITSIEKMKIVKEINYEHPLFSNDAITAQVGMGEIQGNNGIYFAGAWMRYGFHEDGILSAKNAINKLLIDDGHKDKILTIYE
jgi:predicted NAD/FAD-binding protein